MNTWSPPGSRWWKFEFHCHTPASDDYPKNDLTLRRTITPRQWIEAYMPKGFDAIVITDHNTGSWIDRVVAERERMLAEDPTLKIPVIFPGVELGIETGHHILMILPPGPEGTQRIGILLGACGYSGPLAIPGAANGRGTMPLAAVVDAARSHGALVIPAHANDTHGNGIWHHPDHNSLIATLEHRDLFAWEIVDGGIGATPAVQTVTRKKTFTSVRGSDCHTLLDQDVGRCWTWLKMSRATAAGIRLALLDGLASVSRLLKNRPF